MRFGNGRLKLSAPLLAAFALAACGGSDESADGVDELLGVTELADGISDIPVVPGQYRAEFELVDFLVPALNEVQNAEMRAEAEAGTGQGLSFCVTQEDAAGGVEMMLQKIAESECVFSNLDASGNAISAEMECISSDGLEGTFKIAGEVAGDVWPLELNIDQRVPGIDGDGRVQMTMNSKTMRVGECS